MAMATASALVVLTQAERGKFHYQDDGATYDGEFVLVGLPPPAEPQGKKPAVKAGAAKGAAAAAAAAAKEEEPAEPPKRLRHGKGTYTCSAYSYEGDWALDVMEGQGRHLYASGAVYEGEWKAGRYHGQGTYRWPDGRTYQGAFEDNRMHGTGTYTDAEGHQWCGQFFNGAGPGLTHQL